MTPNDIQTDVFELVELLEDKLKNDETELENSLQEMKSQLMSDLESVTRQYERPYSSGDDVHNYVEDFNQVVDLSMEQRNLVWKKTQEHVAVLEKMGRVFKSQGNLDKLKLINSRRAKFERHLYDYANDMKQPEPWLLQSGLQKIAKLQDEETRQMIWRKYQAWYGEHITPYKKLKPVTKVVPKIQRVQKVATGSSLLANVPPEIFAAIFNACDLETCVNLREVDSAWYLLFQQSELALKQKMRARNPWITPGDDLSSWGDCAMVFVARLRTWQSAEDIKSIHITRRKTVTKTVVAFELGRDEKLPQNFSVMSDSHSCPYSCQHFHARERNDEHFLIRDPWTLETSRDFHDATVYVKGDRTVVEGRGDARVTLPTCSIKPEDIDEQKPLRQTESCFVVNLKNGHMYVVPRDQPHFEHGFDVPPTYTGCEDLGGVLMWCDRETSKKFFFADLETKKLREYATCGLFRPIASYNGLMWCQDKFLRLLLPTFVDLEDPEKKVYYSPAKAITGLSRKSPKQCSSSRAAQFCLGRGHDPDRVIEIVDMARGILTSVLLPHSWTGHTFPFDYVTFVGWLDGKFQARVMGLDDARHVRRDMYRKYGVPEENERSFYR